MVTERENTADVGIIVGRFQLHEIHDAHRSLIDRVMAKHKKVIIFLGTTSILLDKRNPLDYITRKQMLEYEYEHKLIIESIPDMKEDDEWSAELDRRIKEKEPIASVMLYGSRDSFIPHYKGKYPVTELETKVYISATDIRNVVSKETIASKEFRAGIIYGIYRKYPLTYPTVDVAILNKKNNEVLLGRKAKEKEYRFIGGFVDPKDENFESAAIREAHEECGHIELSKPEYIGSATINDWRYNKSEDGIKTTFFATEIIFGLPQPNDDIHELKWFNIDELKKEDLVEEHNVLYDLFKNYINKNKK